MSRCRCCLLGISGGFKMIYITVDFRYFTEAWLGVAELHYNSQLQASGKDISGEDISVWVKTQEMPAQSYRLGDVERDTLLRYYMVAPTRSHVLFLNVPFLGWIASQQAMSTMEFPKMRSGESRSLLTLGNFGRLISTNLMRKVDVLSQQMFCDFV